MDDAFISNIVEEMSGAANAATGGASATGGQTVVTSDSSASVQITNVVNASNDGGSSHTIIEKTVNGVKEVTEETKDFAPGEPVIVETHVEAQASGATTHTSGEVDHNTDAATSASDAASPAEGEVATAESWSVSAMFGAVSSFFSNVFSWWSN